MVNAILLQEVIEHDVHFDIYPHLKIFSNQRRRKLHSIYMTISPLVARTTQREKMINEFRLYKVLGGCLGNPKMTRTKFHHEGK